MEGDFRMSINVNGSVGISQNTTEVTKIPVGTTAQRPDTPEAGMIRFNTDEGYVEAYDPDLEEWRGVNELFGSVQATGGTVTDIDGPFGVTYRVHTFTNSGTFEVTRGGKVEYLVVAGGGSGGDGSVDGNKGQDSVFHTVTASAGGAGGGSLTPTSSRNGGSGGGGRGFGGITAGTGTLGQGFSGGAGSTSSPYPAGGGGGSFEVGEDGSGSFSGNGGDGVTSNITGSLIKRSGGGGGGATGSGASAGSGGAGGGGNGGTSGVVNTGSGGGGGNFGGGGGAGGYRCSVTGELSGGGVGAEEPLSLSPQSYSITVGNGGSSAGGSSGAGGSGIVIVRYRIG